MSLRHVSRGVAAFAVALTALYAAGSAYADDATVDGDTAAMSTTDIVANGRALPLTRAGLVQITKSANGQHFSAGEAVSLTVTSQVSSVTGRQTAAVTVPTTWNTGSTFTVPLSTTIAADAATSGTSKEMVDITGLSSGYKVNNASFWVTWTNCTGNKAPVVSIGGVTNGTQYEYGSVPVATCSWTDDNDGSGTATPVVSGPDGKLGTQTVSCSKTDSGGLASTASASYSIVDTTGPALSTVADVSASAVDANGASVNYTAPSATDAVDGDRSVTCTPVSGSTFPLGATPVTCSATDLSGNKGTTTFTVNVADTTAPDVTVPKDVTLDATSTAGAPYTFTATAKDNVDGNITASCDPASGSSFPFGTTPVTCTATDQAGLQGSATFKVTVQDKTAPVVTVHQPAAVEATGPGGAKVSWTAPTADDEVDGSVAVSCDRDSGATFPVGETTVTCTATDTHGNPGTATFTVEVTDTTAPTLHLPTDITAEATSPNGAVVNYDASASDLVDGAVEVTCTPASGTQFALDGPVTVNCSATDAHGNPATGSFSVTVEDTTAPALPELTDVTAEATGPDGASVEYTVGLASDLVDGDVVLDCSPASGAAFALGSNTVSCTATDAHDNPATGTFTVKIQDTTPPAFDPISVPTTEATGPAGAVVTFDPHASDLVDPHPSVVCTPASGSTFALGPTQVSCTATDSAGNPSDPMTFTVNVADTTKPVVTSVATQPIEATSAAGAPVTWVMPTATDLVDGDLPVTCDHEQGSTFPLGETRVTCSAADKSGNTGSSVFTVTVRDTTAPAFGDAPNVTVTATSSAGAKVTYTNPTATDLVDGPTAVTCTPASGSTFPLGITTVNCTTTDKAGNEATTSFTVTVAVSWSGVLAPVTNGGSFKQGSTIPVKFALTGASAGVTNLPATLWVRRLPTATTAGETVAVSTSAATTGNLFRYTDGQYLFNLNTKPLSVGSYELRIDLGDGVQHTVTITLR